MPSDKLLLYALLTQGRETKRKDRIEIAAALGVSERMAYRYEGRCAAAIFALKEKKFQEISKNLQKSIGY